MTPASNTPSGLLDELRKVRLMVAENRLILQALMRSVERAAQRRTDIDKTPSQKKARPIRRWDGTWGWPK